MEQKLKNMQKVDLYNIVRFCKFLGFYSRFCLGRTKHEVHICNLHSKTQLLMCDKCGYSTKKYSSPDGGWRTVRKPGLKENDAFEWKNFPISVTPKGLYKFQFLHHAYSAPPNVTSFNSLLQHRLKVQKFLLSSSRIRM